MTSIPLPWYSEYVEVRNTILKPLVFAFFLALFLILGATALSYAGFSLGKVEFLPASTITVTGEAKSDQKSETAGFSVAVSATNDDKQTAINEVNGKMNEIIAKVKTFGIDEKDIKTQQISTYENQQTELMSYCPNCPEKPTQKRWQANNSIEIKLKDVSKVTALTDLLNSTGATSVSGPNFGLTDADKSADELLTQAINDARTKGEKIAKAAGRRLGKVITVSESGGYGPIYPVALDMAKSSRESIPTPIEPGTQMVYKSVTVIFELR